MKRSSRIASVYSQARISLWSTDIFKKDLCPAIFIQDVWSSGEQNQCDSVFASALQNYLDTLLLQLLVAQNPQFKADEEAWQQPPLC